jgi:ribosomal protein S18 acetylase RimI-like enzyme
MIIRQATSDEDRSAVHRLANVLALTEGPAAAEVPATFQVFVCEVDRQIIGFVAVDKHASDAVQITHLFVSGAHRISGIGKGLLNMALQSVGPDVKEIGVLISPNNAPALALYKSAGFQPDILGEYAGHAEHLSLVLKTTA